MTAFRARVGFGRVLGGAMGQGWSLTIDDDASGCRIVEVRLTDEAMGKALGNFFDGSTSDGEVFDVQRVNKRHETKAVRIPAPNDKNHVAAYNEAKRLNPGWEADRDSHFNSHRWNAEGYLVHLHRWVAP